MRTPAVQAESTLFRNTGMIAGPCFRDNQSDCPASPIGKGELRWASVARLAVCGYPSI